MNIKNLIAESVLLDSLNEVEQEILSLKEGIKQRLASELKDKNK